MDLVLFAKIIFFVSVGLILYVYLGYPMLIFALGFLSPRNIKKAPYAPSVSFIITAFNEERDIRRKLENTIALDYPKEKLEIIVASDCSNDATDRIVREFADHGVKLVRQEHRGGKTSAQNLAVQHAGGEILHFSDATSMYGPDALRAIVENFADETVGCVAGKLIYIDPARTRIGSGARSYWSYETFLKQAESRACSLIGVSGCIYAVRRSSYIPMYPDACSDFLIATLVYKQGLRTVYEPDAICNEETNRRTRKEMKMRVRVIAQTFTDLWRNREMMNPFRSGFYAVQLVSHKVLRYGVPLFLAAAFLSSGFLALYANLFLLLLAAQVLFFGVALAGWLFEHAGVKAGLISMPFYFMLTNIAAVAGFLQFLRGERYAAWEPIRNSG